MTIDYQLDNFHDNIDIMKTVFTKLLVITIIILFSNNADAIKLDTYFGGQTVTDYIEINNKTKLKLPKGKWEVYDRWQWSGHGLKFSCLGIIRVENDEWMESMSVCYSRMGGAYVKYMDQALIEVMFKDKYDGCYERPEYYLLEFYRKGSTT